MPRIKSVVMISDGKRKLQVFKYHRPMAKGSTDKIIKTMLGTGIAAIIPAGARTGKHNSPESIEKTNFFFFAGQFFLLK